MKPMCILQDLCADSQLQYVQNLIEIEKESQTFPQGAGAE
jgi:hypothetical protein